MALYSLHHELPTGYLRNYPVAIYQESRHRQLAALPKWQSFFLIRSDIKRVLAEVHFCIRGTHAHARPAAPFGGISFDPELPLTEIKKFISGVSESLQELGCTSITLVHPPAPYQRSGDLVLALLHDDGFNRTTTELCAVLQIVPGSFRDGLHDWELRKLQQAERKGVMCQKLPDERLADVYRFLATCRAERGTALSMTETQILELASACPEAVQLYVAINEGQWCAAVLGLQDHPEVLYTFYYGHSAATDALSPMVLLLDFVYTDCQERGVCAINLGTSTLNGTTNLPLLQFKLQLGAVPMQKVTLTKTL